MSNTRILVDELNKHLEMVRQRSTAAEWFGLRRDLSALSELVDATLDPANPVDDYQRIEAYFELVDVLDAYAATRGLVGRGGSMLTDPPTIPPTDEPIPGLPVQPVRQKLIDIVQKMKELPPPSDPPPAAAKEAPDHAG